MTDIVINLIRDKNSGKKKQTKHQVFHITTLRIMHIKHKELIKIILYLKYMMYSLAFRQQTFLNIF